MQILNQDGNEDREITCFDMITNVIDETTANICGKIKVEKNGQTISVILQTLGFKCIQGNWKITLFHASPEVVTLRGAEEYPLPFAKSMIQRLKKEIEETAKNIHLRKELELQRMAELDSLTLVYNKRAFENKVKEELEDKETMIHGAFFMLDIDCFKEINDTYGHPFGDEVLLKMAQILVENYKETAIIGRQGGDEFGVFCYEKRTMEQRYAVLNGIQEMVHQILLPASCGEHITCSIGIAKCESEDTTFEELYRKADASLYHVKRNGRDGYAFYEDVAS